MIAISFLLLAWVVFFCMYYENNAKNELSEVNQLKLSLDKKATYLNKIALTIGWLTALLGCSYFVYKTLMPNSQLFIFIIFVITIIILPFFLLTILLISAWKQIFYFNHLKKSGFPDVLLRTRRITRIGIYFSIFGMLIILILTPPTNVALKRISLHFFPTHLAALNPNTWVCPRKVSCKNSTCTSEDGYGNFKYSPNASLNIQDGDYEFLNVLAGTQPKEISCSYGISTVFGPGVGYVLADAQGTIEDDYFKKLPIFNDNWRELKSHLKEFKSPLYSCGNFFGSEPNWKCPFPALKNNQ